MADRMTLQVKDILVTNSTLRRKAALKTDFWPPIIYGKVIVIERLLKRQAL
jgi:hypothetical protein